MTQFEATHSIEVRPDGTVTGTDAVFTGAELVPTPPPSTDSGQLLRHAIGNALLLPAQSVVLTHSDPAVGSAAGDLSGPGDR